MTKKTYIVGGTPILHNGVHLPPGADIELSFDEYRSLGLDLTVLTVDPPAQVNFYEPGAARTAQVMSDGDPVPFPELVPLPVSAPVDSSVSVLLNEAALDLPQTSESDAALPPASDQEQTDLATDPETSKPARRSSKKEGA